MTGLETERMAGMRLQLDIWHPDCWTLEVTDRTNGGLLGHGVYRFDEEVKGRFTAYADTQSDLEAFVETVRESPLTNSVWLMDHQYDVGTATPTPGNATRNLLVAYDQKKSISEALVSRGFIPDKPVWIHDGREQWTVLIDEDRDVALDLLDDVREEAGATIDISQISSGDRGSSGVFRDDLLSERQREVFEFARSNGYYDWPRDVSAADLAARLDISKATFLEHLRKAEAKLMNSLP